MLSQRSDAEMHEREQGSFLITQRLISHLALGAPRTVSGVQEGSGAMTGQPARSLGMSEGGLHRQ